MRTLVMWLSVSALIVASAACQGDDGEVAATAGSDAEPATLRRRVEQLAPPLDVHAPPRDATKTASGLSYKRLVSNDRGVQARRGDTAMVKYTGWRQRTGETFFTTTSRGQPIALDVAHAAPGFAEAVQLMHQGEQIMLWVPAGQGAPEPVVYEIEIVDVIAAAVPGAPARGPDATAPRAARRSAGQ